MFGEKIKQLREANSMTQEDFAEKVLVSRTAVSKWETGKGYPSLDSLKQISLLFDVSIDSLISDEDIIVKKKLDQKKKEENARAMVVLILILSLTVGWFLFRKTEAMHYTADEAMGYGFRGIEHELRCTVRDLEHLKTADGVDREAFSLLCEELYADILLSVETIASFDFGVKTGYNDYDIFWFYSYFFDVQLASGNFDKMTDEEVLIVYDSLHRVCTEFNRFVWRLPKTDNYIGISLKAYDFDKDPSGVREHLAEMEALTAEETEKLKPFI